jgi:hypothetical protein
MACSEKWPTPPALSNAYAPVLMTYANASGGFSPTAEGKDAGKLRFMVE